MSVQSWNDRSKQVVQSTFRPPNSYYNPDTVDQTNFFGLSNIQSGSTEVRYAVFRFRIDNVMQIVREYSPTYFVYGMHWRLMAVLHDNIETNGDGEIKYQKKFGLFLICYGVKCTPNVKDWATFARVGMDIRNQIPGKSNLRRKFHHFYCKDQPDFGFYSLLNTEELTNESIGYVKKGALVVEVVVLADKPLLIPVEPIERPFTINGFVVHDELANLYALEDH